jgi:N-methylhydantoinase A
VAYRLAVDVGGTFTDLLLFNEESGELLAKTPSTNSDPSIRVLTGIHKIASLAGIDPNQISLILQGTTVATNAVLEGKGARAGLITTRGFEQILHVARGQTPGPLAGWIIMIKPDPIVGVVLALETLDVVASATANRRRERGECGKFTFGPVPEAIGVQKGVAD